MTRITSAEPRVTLILLFCCACRIGAQEPVERPSDDSGVKLPALLSAKPLPENANDDALKKLLKARYNAALAGAREWYERKEILKHYATLGENLDTEFGLWKLVVQSGLEAFDKPADKVALLTDYVELTKDFEHLERMRLEAGRVETKHVRRTEYERLNAEVLLLRARREPDGSTAK